MNADKNEGEIKFVSSQSPYKNADPSTEAGASEKQVVIDDLAAVFISSVARNRSITDEKVLSEFGQGLVFVGRKALKRSMIDEISTFEDVMTKVQKPESAPTTEDPTPGGGGPEIKITGELLRSDYSSLVEEFMTEGASAERARILELQEICAGRGVDLKAYIVGGVSAKDAALDILKNSRASTNSSLARLEQNEKELAGLSAHCPAEEDDWSAELETVKNAGWLNDDRI
ncbi:Peptidase family S49 [Pseudobacteriovorax antillogorgiicola]|uniref:Peptidase family S49 n=2 Tax=Pseudobacteriovorax antillogorgiicola TaxID=1513793 RepID=A0A1Y6CPD2_9BACT|nr:peptidase S49-like protein [Pseudobacteriovorax antillogorgiicola]SMF81594.1 Peptidase family S49 [Pseudobacteriovorax antillogorgiicola]